jgi:hypothetical protein
MTDFIWCVGLFFVGLVYLMAFALAAAAGRAEVLAGTK